MCSLCSLTRPESAHKGRVGACRIMTKSHSWLGTSTVVGRLNTLMRGKKIIVELAGWIHESLVKVRGEMVKPWAYHCAEGRPTGTFHGGDPLLLAKSPIDADWLEACAQHVVKKVQDLHDIVTDHGLCPSGKVVLVFESSEQTGTKNA